MAKEFQEGITDATDEQLTEQIRGAIIDETEKRRSLTWVIGVGAAVCLTLAVGWGYFLAAKTPEEKMRESLQRIEVMRQVLQDSKAMVLHSITKPEELQIAISRAIDCAETPLREGDMPHAPYVADHGVAIEIALRGMLRLSLTSGEKQQKFLDDALYRLGLVTLEYYDGGIFKEMPLLQASVVMQQIDDLKDTPNYNPQDLQQLQQKLNEIQRGEPFHIVQPALLLGKWYRSHNDLDRARECFEIGREYVEGMRIGNVFYRGKRPIVPDNLWDSYAGCLEALSEIAYKSGDFRVARSYLLRMFNTPLVTSPLDNKALSGFWEGSFQHPEQIKADIAVLQKAYENTVDLPTYPYFSLGDGVVDWQALQQSLKAKSLGDKDPIAFVAAAMPKNSQHRRGKTRPPAETSPDAYKATLLTALNALVDDTSLCRRLPYEKGQLSTRVKSLLAQQEERNLSREEVACVNRELLEISLPKILRNPYVLSDGTHIHNTLSESAVQRLVTLYEEDLSSDDVDQSLRQVIANRLQEIYQRRAIPTLQELHNTLLRHKENIMGHIAAADSAIESNTSLNEELRHKIRQMENAKTLDIDALLQLKSQQEQTENLVLQARLEKKFWNNELESVDEGMGDLSLDLKQRLGRAQEDLAVAVGQTTEQAATPKPEPSMLVIERQLKLHEEYLQLLQTLKSMNGNVLMKQLQEERQNLEREEKTLAEEVQNSRGEEREMAQAKRDAVQDRLHAIVQEYSKLYDPLRDIVTTIASQEGEIVKSQELLEKTREEMLKILGTPGHEGTLEAKCKTRAALIVAKNDDTAGATLYDAEIKKLTDEISAENARLYALVQTERKAQEDLLTLVPHLVDKGTGNFCNTLQERLKQQDALIAQYNDLWRQNELQQNIAHEEGVILDNLATISSEIQKGPILTQETINLLSRAMADILQSKKILSLRRHELKAALEKSTAHSVPWSEASGKGYLLDTAEMFQLEHTLGINLRQFRNTFEERSAVYGELQTAIIEKERLDAQKINAIRRRNQADVDYLLPCLAEKEALIVRLTEKLAGIDKALQGLQKAYAAGYAGVGETREAFSRGIVSLDTSIEAIGEKISAGMKELQKMSRDIQDFPHSLAKAMTTLQLDNLYDLDAVISEQKRLTEALKDLKVMKARSQYFQAKALFLLGKTLYEQSLLPDYKALSSSNRISGEMLEEERRSGKALIAEYDESYVYSDKLFKGSSEEDGQLANGQMWVDYLEKTALSVFLSDLPKYTTLQTVDGKDTWQMDNEMFIARSRFLAAEIHMKRALRTIQSSRLAMKDNKDAQEALGAARRCFSGFLEAVSGKHGDTEISEETAVSQEFPERHREPIHLEEDARCFLGLIAMLKGNPLEAIDHFRETLSELLAQDMGGTECVDGNLTHKPIDPLLLQQYDYTTQVAPQFTAVLSRHALGHEILYRLGKCYAILAKEELDASLSKEQGGWLLPNGTTSDPKDHATHTAKFQEYGKNAIAYFSQLILSQSYSPYRTAALLQRATVKRQMKLYDSARQDLVSILGTPTREGGSFDVKMMTPKGDLPGELDPGFAHVAFELGQLYLDMHDYAAAAEIFLQSTESRSTAEHIVQARIAYAKALTASQNWTLAHYFLNTLVKDMEAAPEDQAHWYPVDILLDFAEVQHHLGALRGAQETLKKILPYAPRQLVSNDTLSLGDSYGVARLRNDFRDMIRPLAVMAKMQGDIALEMKDFAAAKTAYGNAAMLSPWMAWREDRVFREEPYEAYVAYRDTISLTASWNVLKTQVHELLTTLYAGYRKRSTEVQDASPENVMNLLEGTLSQAEQNRKAVKELLKPVTAFYLEEWRKLPEAVKKRGVEELRVKDRASNGQKIVRYEALKHLREAYLAADKAKASVLLVSMAKRFGDSSVENKLLNDFCLAYSKDCDLQEKDRSKMLPSKDNIDNLLSIEDADNRLSGIDRALETWLTSQMTETGLDDIFIPMSPQAQVLEEVALYRVALLAYSDMNEDYAALNEIAKHYMAALDAKPRRVHQVDVVWQMVEVAALAAHHQHDWENVAAMNAFLLQKEHAPLFIGAEEQRRCQKEIHLAEAHLALAEKGYQDVVFMMNEEERATVQQQAEKRQTAAKEILMKLSEMTTTDADTVTAKIRAKQLLDTIKA